MPCNTPWCERYFDFSQCNLPLQVAHDSQNSLNSVQAITDVPKQLRDNVRL